MHWRENRSWHLHNTQHLPNVICGVTKWWCQVAWNYIYMWMYIIVKYIGACVWRVKSIWITRACVTNIAISLNSRENVCIENPSQYAVGTYLLRTYALYGKLYGDLEMLASAVLNKSTFHWRAVVANRMQRSVQNEARSTI